MSMIRPVLRILGRFRFEVAGWRREEALWITFPKAKASTAAETCSTHSQIGSNGISSGLRQYCGHSQLCEHCEHCEHFVPLQHLLHLGVKQRRSFEKLLTVA